MNPCKCIDCGGDAPAHSSDCTYMLEIFGDPAGEPTHYVLPRGVHSMVKDADFFAAQGGLVDDWGTYWRPVFVDRTLSLYEGIEHARELAAHMTPMEPRWKTLEPHLPDHLALRPGVPLYQQCQGKWRSPIA